MELQGGIWVAEIWAAAGRFGLEHQPRGRREAAKRGGNLPPQPDRLLARGQQVEGTTNLESMEARRVNAGGKIYRFDYSRGIGFVPPRLTKSKEEDDVGADTDAG